ncbi:membrane fusion protein, multidrug efflux system [Sphingomonas laterariae]|uniref:Membrane fusion protein, multidrug efflux system n=1 Tax=Edaphosphingomonas laterariae TaxID=861865 RepID=A0A239CGR6_9SPHN|nr:efflux RND transporter periplasmic adaptor subunit [Sphingomonas laterariae]SNS18533.1 membrane fusion protein, multidrug efflux system [Sphingomonas laterariae]
MRHFLLPALALTLVSCGSGEPKGGARQAPLVTAAIVAPARFVDRIEAVGTARANEQVTLSAPVTQRIERINFQDGGYVSQGQVIAVLAAGQQNAQLADARARAREAEQQLTRLNALKDRGFATNASVDAQIAAAASARAQAAEAIASIGDRVIRAPFAGYASLRTVSAGAVVTAGTEIATISDISQIKLDFPVPETMLSSVAQGQPIVAKAAAFPDTPFRGTIATIDPVVDPATRSVMVRAVLPNRDLALKPGMLLTVAIEAKARTAPAVPELAVVGQGADRFVFLIGDNDKVKRVPVKVGVRDSGMIEIVEGLKPGQKIVGEGIVKVADGSTIRTAGAKEGQATKQASAEK